MKETTFMERCKGISMIIGMLALLVGAALFGTAALIQSATPAQAGDGPQMTNGVGKYQMALSAVVGNDGKTYWYVLAYDTETGRSKFYYGIGGKGTYKAESQYNLPSSPL